MRFSYYEICRINGQQMSLIANINEIFVIFSALYSSSKYEKKSQNMNHNMVFCEQSMKKCIFQNMFSSAISRSCGFFLHIMALSNMISSSLSWWYGIVVPIMRKFCLKYEKFALNVKKSALYFENNLFHILSHIFKYDVNIWKAEIFFR